MTYRLLLAALFLSILVANGTTSGQGYYWFIYLTHWSLLLQTVQLMASAAVVLEHVYQPNQRKQKLIFGFLIIF